MAIAKTERFEYLIPGYAPLVWNIVLAKQLAADPRWVESIVTIGRSEMRAITERNSWEPSRVADVNIADPGIGAPFIWEGTASYLLIDGTHRCVRAYRERKPFAVRLLTDEAARRCYISGPTDLMPWGQEDQ